jgi:hypothetical protein
MTPYLEMSYRHGRPFAAYLYLAPPGPDRVATSRPYGHGMVLDLDTNHQPIGLEITDPGQVRVADVLLVLRAVGMTCAEEDLSPLAA